MTILDQILADTRARVAALHGRADAVRTAAEAARPPASFRVALGSPRLAVIAEVKRRSPSRGAIDMTIDPIGHAQRYVEGGAAAISVLTEPDHFAGSPDDLADVSAAVSVPTLRKDFIVDPLQVWEARSLGAGAVLLIVAALAPDELASLSSVAATAGLDALVEVHTVEEARIAVDSGAEIIGVNNRDLTSFEVDLGTAEVIAELLGDIPLTVAESGIRTAEDAGRMVSAGYDAVLVGEALVRSEDPATLISELRGE